MKLKKRQFGITKQTTKYLITFIVGGYLFLAVHWFFSTYTFQSPIRERIVSPISEDQDVGVTLIPTRGVEERKATPSPSPKPKRTLIPVVEAAEIRTNGDPVKEYIVTKFGKDAPIMLKIAQCESGTQAYNWYNKWLGVTEQEADERGYAVGVFMIYRSVHKHLSFQDMLDYKKNIDYAHGL